ncbi:hypothetical protein EDB81DRAFT_814506 [Dactylonectria macrodidyma]|uniref:Zn(2)-C6 fungal-type domain-containing protein n=1 Tax=Dactylonectria macrodidyma TaxID=307937 RepID=A0A9P9DK23_9HYPO|nr:hypothetical protein EDB81DRAFT_814506 [Dactylonectria macrodidyma]
MAQAARKRNVSSRDRTGCTTCRARRLKCDEGKPECNNCTRLSLPCGGYTQRVVFKDQTERLKQKHGQDGRRRSRRGSGAARADKEKRATAHFSPCHQQSIVVATNENAGAEISLQDCQWLINPESPQPDSYDSGISLGVIPAITSPTVPSPPHTIQVNVVTPFYANTSPLLNEPSPSEPHTGAGCSPADVVLCPPVPSIAAALDTSDDNRGSVVLTPPQVEPATGLIHYGLFTLSRLSESARFVEDVVYYHHLRDSSPFGILSILSLDDITEAEYLDSTFFHAALALSALDISLSNSPAAQNGKAALHALEHFVTALGVVGQLSGAADQTADGLSRATIQGHNGQQKAISWLATVLLLAQFELQRGQISPWYTHCRGAIAFLSQNLQLVRDSPVGGSLIRSFSRIAALLDIYDRAYSVHSHLAVSDVSASLIESLTTSPLPFDRLLFILPRVIQLEEEWRSNPGHKLHWQEQARGLVDELEDWSDSLEPCDVPRFDDQRLDGASANRLEPGDELSVSPLSLPDSSNPVQAATNYMHYLVSILRLKYPLKTNRQLPSEAEDIVLNVCRLAAGVPTASCAAINAYGHGMLPALMNVYYISDDAHIKSWIRTWLNNFPRDREGIWNVRHAERLLTYVDREYSRLGPRAGWTIIKVRMVDLDVNSDDATPSTEHEEGGNPDRFSVEIYSKSKRGWSIDFVEIE